MAQPILHIPKGQFQQEVEQGVFRLRAGVELPISTYKAEFLRLKEQEKGRYFFSIDALEEEIGRDIRDRYGLSLIHI